MYYLHTKIENTSKKRSPRTYNPRKRLRTETDSQLEELIEDSEATSENSNTTNAVDNRSKCHSASDDEKQLLETLVRYT